MVLVVIMAMVRHGNRVNEGKNDEKHCHTTAEQAVSHIEHGVAIYAAMLVMSMSEARLRALDHGIKMEHLPALAG